MYVAVEWVSAKIQTIFDCSSFYRILGRVLSTSKHAASYIFILDLGVDQSELLAGLENSKYITLALKPFS